MRREGGGNEGIAGGCWLCWNDNRREAAFVKSDFGVCGVVGGKMVIELLAGTMRLDRGRIAAVGCSSMGAGSIGRKKYCGNLLWQSSLTLLPL